ncbi:unnamed protein product [Auanema sp. JU1783]|nr:unnamed protein product [Auanema sp. JU1783]
MRLRPSPTQRSQTESPPTRSIYRPHPRIFKVSLVVFVFSLLACAAASGLSSSQQPCSFRSEIQQHVSKRLNSSKSSSMEQCIIWGEDSPQELCSVEPNQRVRKLRSTFLFSQIQPLSLYEVLAAGSRDGRLQSGLRVGENGVDCVTGRDTVCLRCFQHLANGLRRLDEAYQSFDQALQRFDCMPAVDTASATRPFSPNGSCNTCRSWYRRWLLVQTINMWISPPCVNWCYYAQLACPHLATSKVVDYAGHPSFQCRDLEIPSREHSESRCECVHPCDLRGMVPNADEEGTGVRRSGRRSAKDHEFGLHDFYASQSHCRARDRECGRLRTTGDRTTAHDRRQQRLKTPASGVTSSAASSTSSTWSWPSIPVAKSVVTSMGSGSGFRLVDTVVRLPTAGLLAAFCCFLINAVI